MEASYEDASRRLEEALASLSISERKRIALQTEVEDLRAACDNVSINKICIYINIFTRKVNYDVLVVCFVTIYKIVMFWWAIL